MPDILNGKVDMTKYQRIEYIDCECGSSDHVLRYVLDRGSMAKEDGDYDWPPELYTEVQLADYPSFWQRVWRGFRYMFGYKSRYGHWDCTILKHTDIPKLRSILDEYDKLVDEFEKRQAK